MGLDVDVRNEKGDVLFSGYATHNLIEMAQKAGLYIPMWHPDRLSITKAEQMIPYLKTGLFYLLDNKEKLEALNPPNGWGTYNGFLDMVWNYLRACSFHPDGEIYARS